MRNLHYFILLLGIGFLLYFPALTSGFAGDDYVYLVEQPFIRNLQFPLEVFSKVISLPTGHSLLFGYHYRPLPFLVYTLLYQITHANPFWFHLLQFLLYITTVYLLYRFFTSFFSEKISLLLSLIFLIHPANDDLGAYIAALHDLLSFFSSLQAIVLLQKNKDTLPVKASVTILLLCSLLSKESGLLLVLFTGVYLMYSKRLRQYLIPIAFAGILYTLLRVSAALSGQVLFAGPPVPAAGYDLLQHLYLIPQLMYAFLREIILPNRLAMKPDAFSPVFIKSIIPSAILLLLAAAITLFLLWLKRTNKKYVKNTLFFVSVSLLGMMLYLQIIPLDVLFAVRFLYITEIGLLGLLGVVLSVFPKINPRWQRVIMVLFVLYMALFAFETFYLNTLWKNWQQHTI